MYRLTTMSRNALGEEYPRTWEAGFRSESAAIERGEDLLEDERQGFGCVIGYRVTPESEARPPLGPAPAGAAPQLQGRGSADMSIRQLTTGQVARLEAACPSWCASRGAHDWQQDYDGSDFAISVWEHTRTFEVGEVASVTVVAVLDVDGDLVRTETRPGRWHGDYDTYEPAIGLAAAVEDLTRMARCYEQAAAFAGALADRPRVSAGLALVR